MAALVGELSRTGYEIFSEASAEVLADFDISLVYTQAEKEDTADLIIARFNGYEALEEERDSLQGSLDYTVAVLTELASQARNQIARITDYLALHGNKHPEVVKVLQKQRGDMQTLLDIIPI